MIIGCIIINHRHRAEQPQAGKPNGPLVRAKKIYRKRLSAEKNWKLIDLATVDSIHWPGLDEWFRKFTLAIDGFCSRDGGMGFCGLQKLYSTLGQEFYKGFI